MSVAVLLLAAGVGSRLAPLTDFWPKCLMPINGRPLLDFWLASVIDYGIRDITVNLHHHHDLVRKFLAREIYADEVTQTYEEHLHGTAGTLRNNAPALSGKTILVAHADNWSQFNLAAFLDAHENKRPKDCVITMMTFETDDPASCGILDIDDNGVVQHMAEKDEDAKGTTANAAVYVFSPEVLEWICNAQSTFDISTDVLPHFMGRIYSYRNDNIHRDIGTPASLALAQHDASDHYPPVIEDEWMTSFTNGDTLTRIHAELKKW